MPLHELTSRAALAKGTLATPIVHDFLKAFMRPIAHPSLSEITLPYVLYALSDPIRLEIVRRLKEASGELSCADATGAVLPKSTMSFHFKALREAGLIRTRQEGRTKLSQIHPGFEKRFPGLLKVILAQIKD